MIAKFTSILYELIVSKGLSLKDSLEVISERNNNIVSKTGKYLLNVVLQGTSLSNGLRKCPYIKFDNIYILFIYYGEQTGNIKETITFLNKRCNRLKENNFKLVEASSYPILVIFISLCLCLYLYSDNIYNFNNEIFIYLFILISICIFLFLGFRKIVGENKIYEAFLGIGFLVKAGINLYDAVGCGAQIVGVSSCFGIKFQKAREKLLLGMNMHQAFSLGKKYENAFFYAEKTGGKTDVFEKLANWIGDDDEKKRKICFSLIEPIFILLTGLFLIVLVVNFFLPYMSDISWV